MGSGIFVLFAAAPPQPVGTGLSFALHASGYAQPAIVVTMLAVSLASAHPLPCLTFALTAALDRGTGVKVIMLAVAVYEGRADAGTCTPAMLAGGHCPKSAVAAAAIVPAPAPPVM